VLYGSRLVGEVESVRFLTPDVAVVHLLGSSGPMVQLGGRFVRWRTDRARRKQR